MGKDLRREGRLQQEKQVQEKYKQALQRPFWVTDTSVLRCCVTNYLITLLPIDLPDGGHSRLGTLSH